MDDVLIAEMMKAFASRFKVSLDDHRLVHTVRELLLLVLKEMNFEARCKDVFEVEVDMHRRGDGSWREEEILFLKYSCRCYFEGLG